MKVDLCDEPNSIKDRRIITPGIDKCIGQRIRKNQQRETERSKWTLNAHRTMWQIRKVNNDYYAVVVNPYVQKRHKDNDGERERERTRVEPRRTRNGRVKEIENETGAFFTVCASFCLVAQCIVHTIFVMLTFTSISSFFGALLIFFSSVIERIGFFRVRRAIWCSLYQLMLSISATFFPILFCQPRFGCSISSFRRVYVYWWCTTNPLNSILFQLFVRCSHRTRSINKYPLRSNIYRHYNGTKVNCKHRIKSGKIAILCANLPKTMHMFLCVCHYLSISCLLSWPKVYYPHLIKVHNTHQNEKKKKCCTTKYVWFLFHFGTVNR